MRAAAAALLLLAAAPAAAQTCGEHVVRPGETLGAIARAAPGAPTAQALFEANRDRLSSPDLIAVGQTLRLPCPPGETPAGTGDQPAAEAPRAEDPAPDAPAEAEAEAEAAPGAAGPEAAPGDPDPHVASERPGETALPSPPPTPPDPEAGPIRLAWGGDAAAMPAAGRARARLLAALERGAPGREVQVEPAAGEARARIAPGGEADLAFAWIAPDCAALPRLDAVSAELCARYVFSAPLAEAQTAWFVRADDRARTAEDLSGLRICRPEGRPAGDLAALRLAPPRARRVAPATAADCLRLLRAGEAEAAALFVEDAPAPGPDLRRLEGLGGPQALVALAHPANPRGRAALAALDRGLAALAQAEAEAAAAGDDAPRE
ncbi:LysM peptidoglycan-binding domain-containing protein [Albimonas pacifica]|uniref:LysM domain-containing protein n=1 Tax=Albimonas pacifica TaxID=1114924 RepID=A0A1I3D1A9_9RHOB|nr:LysM peptidoglycan-binding domain-containing protein [Albimonas pacifica]SFH80319.1 LysM domain-containing protein [Albimonas pacifica]